MKHISRATAVKIIYWNAAAAVLVVALAGAALVRRIHRYDRLIVEAAREYKVDPRLISAVIWRESRFKPGLRGGAGEIGLMQVTEPAAREWAQAEGIEDFEAEDLFHPRVNLRAGTWYLGRAAESWSDRSDPLPYALAEYNAGRSNARRWAEAADGDARDFWEHITYPTTKRYVRDVLTRYRGEL
jgi:soluble lytic murein transglycosylase